MCFKVSVCRALLLTVHVTVHVHAHGHQLASLLQLAPSCSDMHSICIHVHPLKRIFYAMMHRHDFERR